MTITWLPASGACWTARSSGSSTRVLGDPPRLPSAAVADDAASPRGGLSAAALRRRVAGDIDAIVAKALAKSPAQRYASVEQLDADIARHLALRPIAARAGSRGYRAAKFLRRNALTVVFTAIVSALAATLVGLQLHNVAETQRQSEHLAYERDQAQQRERQAGFERNRAQQVSEFVVGLFKASMPGETNPRPGTFVTAQTESRPRATISRRSGPQPRPSARERPRRRA